jgi:hypothetical protein
MSGTCGLSTSTAGRYVLVLTFLLTVTVVHAGGPGGDVVPHRLTGPPLHGALMVVPDPNPPVTGPDVIATFIGLCAEGQAVVFVG